MEGEFLRRAKGRPAGENLFDALLAGFRQHASLFAQEGISLKGMRSVARPTPCSFPCLCVGLFAFEDLLERPLSPRMRRALRNRHLSVLSTLLMLQIEKEQAQYRRLMHLAELLCIEEYRLAVPTGAATATDSKLPPALQGEIDRILSLQRRPPCASLCSPEELVQLQALCHEYLHAKRQYISLLRKIRAGAVYALFQANFMLRRLDRMSRHLLRARQHACDANTLDQDAIETNTDS